MTDRRRAEDDYLILCGEPKHRRVWDPIRHCYIDAICVDIGRAPQPAPTLTHDDLIKPAPQEQGWFATNKVLHNHNQLMAYLSNKSGYVLLRQIIQDLGLSKSQIYHLIGKHPDVYESKMFPVRVHRNGRSYLMMGIRLKVEGGPQLCPCEDDACTCVGVSVAGAE